MTWTLNASGHTPQHDEATERAVARRLQLSLTDTEPDAGTSSAFFSGNYVSGDLLHGDFADELRGHSEGEPTGDGPGEDAGEPSPDEG